ncbi:hypothetical protein KXW13_007147, partial [Aspergillus fumigatus]
ALKSSSTETPPAISSLKASPRAATDAPRYFIAFGVHLGCYVCLTLAIIFLRFWLALQNKKKARVLEENGLSAADNNLTHAFEDRTDQENLHFRYIY